MEAAEPESKDWMSVVQESPSLTKLIAQVNDLAVLPHVVFKVLELSGSTENPASEIEKAITVDPGFSSKVLILANSASNALPKKVSSIREALIFLGYRSVRQLAMTVGIYDMFVGKTDRDSLLRRSWWRHSVDSAVSCRWLAEKTRKVSADDAYTCGLLHLIGKTILDRLGDGSYRQVEDMVMFGIKDYKAEEAVFGFNHMEVSIAAATKWALPETLISGLCYLRVPDENHPHRALRACTALGSAIATLAVEGATVDQEDSLRFLPAWAFEALEIAEDKAMPLVLEGENAIAQCKLQL
ncbi:MAG: HDOD domain-containing protein [Fimbriimonas ginsengisoli]|uniref:HDOD domain-containing protein n=1 Tax=Fimbriimonas ginsengisoli TaxID=1005039 RepID=A0A931M1S4_FIMGI|nr:HDOD domain-containing protein [Fimbriimonas ginsengisoli]